MIKKILILFSASLISCGLFSSTFEGLSIGIGAQVETIENRFKDTLYGVSTQNDHGNTFICPTLDLNYSWRVYPCWFIGLGVHSNPNNSPCGIERVRSGATDFCFSAHLRGQYGIYVKPMYTLDEKTCLYAKAGYESARLVIQDITGELASFTSASFVEKMRLRGYRMGLGIKRFITERLFIEVEASYTTFRPRSLEGITAYNDRTSSEMILKSCSGNVGIGLTL